MKLLDEETYRFPLTMMENNIPMKNIPILFLFFHEKDYEEDSSHQQAAIQLVKFANQKKRYPMITWNKQEHLDNRIQEYTINPTLMTARRLSHEVFFSISRKPKQPFLSNYAYAFFQMSSNYLGKVDHFIQMNDLLFPDKEQLIIYEWNNTWSDYFHYGRQHRGAFIWTIYDPKRNKFTVINASIL
ncbi:hypothetical protein [Enterococcus mundtii]|uniref:hypothetical protein n=1 Tax=Enterococcus mundtii TaxID=53346 RepID=UPI00115954D5|nr:hypothetical protein [Enterococcus mundtii]